MKRYGIEDLLQLMACLRDAVHGCPWDLQQSYEDIVPFTLEEAYEVADAIERGAFDELPGELGDLLFQVVFYARIAEEEGRFDFPEVVHQLVSKLLIRHPHVFPDATLASFGKADDASLDEIKGRWESQKARERSARGQQGVFDDVPVNLPALSRAQKIQKRARGVGYDWADPDGVLEKLTEELAELQSARCEGAPEQVVEELGDLLFTVVSLGRHLGVDNEQALRLATDKFTRRMRTVLAIAEADSIDLTTADTALKDELWNRAKAHQHTDT